MSGYADFPDDLCVCDCPRWEHWCERLCFDYDLLALSNACDDFRPAPVPQWSKSGFRSVGA